jgi:hypothetical protein
MYIYNYVTFAVANDVMKVDSPQVAIEPAAVVDDLPGFANRHWDVFFKIFLCT